MGNPHTAMLEVPNFYYNTENEKNQENEKDFDFPVREDRALSCDGDDNLSARTPARENQNHPIILTCPTCSTYYIYKGCRCGDRFKCKWCRKKRINRLREIYEKVLINCFRFPAMLTVTYKRIQDLKTDYEHFIKCIRLFEKGKEFKKRVKRYFGAIEIDDTHIHIHYLVDCKWWEQKKISEEWLKITGHSKVCDIRRVSGKKNKKRKKGKKTIPIREAIKEIFKYITKDYEMTEEIKEVLRGRRLVRTSKNLGAMVKVVKRWIEYSRSSLDTSEISGLTKLLFKQRKCVFCDTRLRWVRGEDADIWEKLQKWKWVKVWGTEKFEVWAYIEMGDAVLKNLALTLAGESDKSPSTSCWLKKNVI